MELKKGYKQTEVGVIPKDWEVKSVGDFATVGSGGTPSRKNTNFWDGDIPWITTTQIDGCVIHSAEQYITRLGLEESAAKYYPKGTILMAMYGQGKTRGKTAILGIDATINQACAAVVVTDTVDSQFLLHYLISQYEKIRELSNAGSQENLNSNIVKSIKVLFPVKSEQTAIAKTLSDTDTLIQSLTRLIAKKRQIKQGAIQNLLTGKKRLPGLVKNSGYKQTEIGRIPEDWDAKAIGQICKLINGRGFKPFEWKKEGLPIIRIQNLNGSGDFNYFQGNYDKKIEVENGQLLFAWSGSRGTSFGPHIWKGPLSLLNYHTWKIVVNENEVIQSFFLHALKQLTKFIEDKAHGASALVHTQKWEMEGFKFPLPSTKAEQTAIAKILSDMDAEIAELEKKRAKYQQIKQGMMQNLLTGKIRLI